MDAADRLIVGIGDDVRRAPQRAAALAPECSEQGAARVGDAIGRTPVDDPIGFDAPQRRASGLVGVDLDVLLQTERLLLDVRDRSGAGVDDVDLRPQRDEPEA